MFDFCGENNLKKHHLDQTACKQARSILKMMFLGLALGNLSAGKKYRQCLYFLPPPKVNSAAFHGEHAAFPPLPSLDLPNSLSKAAPAQAKTPVP